MWKQLAVALLIACGNLRAQVPMSDVVKSFVKVNAPVVALEHVRVIDGSGAAPVEDQAVIIEGGRIRAVGSPATTPAPAGATVLDLTGYTVIPGLVGMHDHMFYPSPRTGRGVPPVYTELAFSGPRLYLAGGVTSLRTTGSIALYRHRREEADRLRRRARSQDSRHRALPRRSRCLYAQHARTHRT